MFFKKEGYLVSDIGGTKTVIALVDSKTNTIITKKIFLNKDIKHYTDTLVHLIASEECKQYNIKRACIAVAGQLNKDRTVARLTNYDWTIDSNNILVRTPIHHVTLINDFEAIGLGINTLKDQDYVELTNFGRNTNGAIAVIGAGTGLGMSILPYNYENKDRMPMLSEGGHVDLPISSNDPIDIKLQDYLIKKKKYIDAEDLVSGRGIVNIYNFLLTQKIKHNAHAKLAISKVLESEKPAFITKYALEDKDGLCIRVLELFIKYYARVSKNLILTTMSTELIMAGGIAPKIVSALQDVFIDELVEHGNEKIRKILEQTTVIVITDPDISLKGALNALKV